MKAPSGLAKQQRRALARLWLTARVPIVIALLGFAIAGGLVVGYDRYQRWSEEQRRQAIEQAAQALARDTGRMLVRELEALTANATGEDLPRPLAANDRAALEQAEARLRASREGVLAVRIVPVGYDEVHLDEQPPFGFAVLDLMRRSEESGRAPPPEVHLLGEPEQHITLVTRVEDGAGNLVGHVRWALEVGLVEQVLAGAEASDGYAELLQRVPQGRALVLASVGSKAARIGSPIINAVPGTAWRIAYWPERAGVGTAGMRAVVNAVVGAVLILTLGGVALWFARRRRAAPAAAADAAPAAEAPRGEVAASGAAPEAPAIEPEPIGPPPLPEVDLPEAERAPGGQAPGGQVDETHASLPAAIFRAYDVRGVVGSGLSPEAVRLIGRAIGSEAYDRGQQTLVVGCDGRLSSGELLEALVEGLRATGRDVIDVGRVPTPVLYFATHYLNTGSGVIVTGSHNGPEYNGLKIMLAGETLFGDAIAGLRDRALGDDLMSGEGTLQSMDVLPEYIRRITEEIPVALGNAYRVVVDCGNGIAGEVAPKLIRALGHDVVELFCEVDGRFPNHPPDPSVPEHLRDLASAVRENEADLGFAFDGDGDRIGLVDGKGRIVLPDRLMMLYARDVLSRNPGAGVVFDVKCSSRLGKVIEKLGGKPILSRSGHSFMKDKMQETGALLGGELSGHIFFRDRWYGFDDGMYAAARLLELLLGFKHAPTDIFARLPAAVATPEIRVTMGEGEAGTLVEALLAAAPFEGAELNTLDGLRAEYPDGWGLVRASNTAPELVLRFEADSKEALERIRDTFRQALLAHAPGLSLPF